MNGIIWKIEYWIVNFLSPSFPIVSRSLDLLPRVSMDHRDWKIRSNWAFVCECATNGNDRAAWDRSSGLKWESGWINHSTERERERNVLIFFVLINYPILKVVDGLDMWKHYEVIRFSVFFSYFVTNASLVWHIYRK